MGFFSGVLNAFKSVGPKLLRGLRQTLPKIGKGIKAGSKAVVKGIKRLFKGKPKEATAKVGREVIRSGKKGKNLIRKVARPRKMSIVEPVFYGPDGKIPVSVVYPSLPLM